MKLILGSCGWQLRCVDVCGHGGIQTTASLRSPLRFRFFPLSSVLLPSRQSATSGRLVLRSFDCCFNFNSRLTHSNTLFRGRTFLTCATNHDCLKCRRRPLNSQNNPLFLRRYQKNHQSRLQVQAVFQAFDNRPETRSWTLSNMPLLQPGDRAIRWLEYRTVG